MFGSKLLRDTHRSQEHLLRATPLHLRRWGFGSFADMTAPAGSMPSKGIFSVQIKATEIPGAQHRLGELTLAGRQKVQTPNYFPLTSRGSLPHISQDMMRDHAPGAGIYTALEDCESPLTTRPPLQGLIGLLFLEPLRHRESSFQCSTCVQHSRSPSCLPLKAVYCITAR